MRKVQLIKEIEPSANGEDITYSVEIDGVYISGTATNDRTEAERYFEVLSKEPSLKSKEVIKELTV